jgi:hypothetical protein
MMRLCGDKTQARRVVAPKVSHPTLTFIHCMDSNYSFLSAASIDFSSRGAWFSGLLANKSIIDRFGDYRDKEVISRQLVDLKPHPIFLHQDIMPAKPPPHVGPVAVPKGTGSPDSSTMA